MKPSSKLYQDFAIQAIQTRFLGPTDRRGARIKARAAAGSVILDWDHALDTFENHAAAALALASKYGWTKQIELVGGGLFDGSYVFTGVRK